MRRGCKITRERICEDHSSGVEEDYVIFTDQDGVTLVKINHGLWKFLGCEIRDGLLEKMQKNHG